MIALKILAAGAAAGIVANGAGYLITGRLFHGFQAKTPGTWRATESWASYIYATVIRVLACIGIAFLYAGVGAAANLLADGAILRGASFGSMLWAVTVVPVIAEAALFVNWHRGFVLGLLLDWWVVCTLSCVSAALVSCSV